MREYYGTFKMCNGTFFKVYVDSNGMLRDASGIKIEELELNDYERID